MAGATYFNHSIEIFNPTELPIDLSQYEIALVPEEGENSIVELMGTIPSEGVFVISNTAASPSIDAVTDVLDSLLYFEGKVAIELVKEGTVIDKVGKKGLGVDASTIDLDSLLNDPNYLNSLHINLGSIENLVIRRKRSIQQGNTDFLNEELLEEWMIYPSFVISDLGTHFSACTVPMILWQDIEQFDWEFEIQETDGAFPGGSPMVWASGKIILTEALPDDLDFSIFAASHEYFPMDDDATFDDWESVDISSEFTIPAGQTAMDFPMLAWPIIDAFEENPEGFGLKVVAIYNGNFIADEDNDVLDIRIIPPFTNAKDQARLNASLSAYPTIASEHITLESNDPELKIEEIKIFSLEGKFVKRYKFKYGQFGNIKLDLTGTNGKGYHLLAIKTNKGIAVKKFYKH